MLWLSVAGFVLVAGCAKPAGRSTSADGVNASSATTVTIPRPSRVDGGAHASDLDASSPVPRADDDPFSLEPRNPALEPSSGECAGACRGSVGRGVERELTERAKRTHACYRRALAQDPTLSGRLLVEIRIGRSGAVCGARLLKNELLASNVSACAVGVLRSPAYSAPEGGECVTVNIPLSFVRASDAGAP